MCCVRGHRSNEVVSAPSIGITGNSASFVICRATPSLARGVCFRFALPSSKQRIYNKQYGLYLRSSIWPNVICAAAMRSTCCVRTRAFFAPGLQELAMGKLLLRVRKRCWISCTFGTCRRRASYFLLLVGDDPRCCSLYRTLPPISMALCARSLVAPFVFSQLVFFALFGMVLRTSAHPSPSVLSLYLLPQMREYLEQQVHLHICLCT